jgi:hypothetical protein
MRLLDELGFTALSLKEFWKVLQDAETCRDKQMLSSLQSSGFVEFLHTVIENNNRFLDKPAILDRNSSFTYEGLTIQLSYDYEGERQEVIVPSGTPGLIRSAEIDGHTGLPAVVHSPDIYKDPTLWRYWSPDAEKNVATRGYIFLLGQPALDLKVHLSEALPCLGIRPCATKITLPIVTVYEEADGVTLEIEQEGETLTVREKDFFSVPTAAFD